MISLKLVKDDFFYDTIDLFRDRLKAFESLIGVRYGRSGDLVKPLFELTESYELMLPTLLIASAVAVSPNVVPSFLAFDLEEVEGER